MPVTSFNVDAQTDEVLEKLKNELGATSKAEVLRKGIALLKAASDRRNPDGTVVLKGSFNNEPSQEITILLR